MQLPMIKLPHNISEKSVVIYPLIIFVVALGLRLVYMFTSKNNPFFSVPIVDMDFYWRLAGTLVTQGPFGVSQLESAWKPAFYPFFLACVRFFVGNSVFKAQIIQSVLGSINCVLLYYVAKKLFNTRTSFLAGLMMACYGTFIFYDACFLPVTLNTCMILCFLLGVSGLHQDKRSLPWFVPGVFMALAANAHQIILAVVPVIPVVQYFWYCHAAGKQRPPAIDFYQAVCKRFACFLCGMLVVMAVFAIIKYEQSRDLSAPSNNAGVNFYIGNNPRADGVSVPPEGVAWMRLINEPVVGGQLIDPSKPENSKTSRTASRVRYCSQDLSTLYNYLRKSADKSDTVPKSGHSTYFYRKAFDWIFAHPLTFLQRYVKKLSYCFSAVEIKNNVNMYRYGDYSPILRCLLRASPFISFPFGIVFPLAIIGMVLCFRSSPRRFLHLYLYLVAVPAGTALFFVCARYRMVMVPVLLLFTAVAVEALPAAIKKRKWERRHGYLLGLLVAMTILCNYQNRFLMKVNADEDYLDFQQLGKVQFGLNHQLAAAEESITNAIALNPGYVDSYYYMAAIQREKGDPELALACLKAALAKDPKYQEARELVAEIEIERGNYKNAEAELLNVLFSENDWYGFISPSNAAQRLGNLYFSMYGNLPVAAAFYDRYLQFNPDNKLEANKNLSKIKQFLKENKERDYHVMIDYLENVVKTDPNDTAAGRRLAALRALQKAAMALKSPS
jgi:tetratricopeptide (TPR) repeat protein